MPVGKHCRKSLTNIYHEVRLWATSKLLSCRHPLWMLGCLTRMGRSCRHFCVALTHVKTSQQARQIQERASSSVDAMRERETNLYTNQPIQDMGVLNCCSKVGPATRSRANRPASSPHPPAARQPGWVGGKRLKCCTNCSQQQQPGTTHPPWHKPG